MTRKQYLRYKRRREMALRRNLLRNIFTNLTIVLFIFILILMQLNLNDQTAAYDSQKDNESQKVDVVVKPTYSDNHLTSGITAEISKSLADVEVSGANTTELIQIRQEFEWTEHEEYLLARIVMAEAEGCDYSTKQYVAMCVLNRVLSNEFPDSIEEVIFQPKQFSPITNGRWDRVEPNDECYEAVKSLYGIQYPMLAEWSMGCLYFESCEGESWHSRNLTFLYESEEMKFYK